MAGIRLEFAQFGDFDSFDVIRSTSSMSGVADIDLPSPIVTGLTTMYYVDTTVVVGTTYYYKARVWRGGSSAVSGEIQAIADRDIHYSSVSVLMHFNGANGSSTFTDEKSNVWSTNTSATLSTVQSKFGGSSLKLSKSSAQFLSAPYSSNIDLLTGAFTIEGWFYPVSVVSGGTILFCTGGSAIAWNGTDGIHINLQTTTAGRLYVQISKNSGSPFDVSTTATLNLGAWNFISASWDGATKVYAGVNGVVQKFTTSGIARPSTNPTARIGTIPGLNGGVNLYDGYVDDFRITKGVVRYTSDYTPPTKPFLNN